MSYRNSNIFNVIQSIKSMGFVLPEGEDDIQDFEQALKEHDIPPLPDNLNTISKIFQKGFSNPNDKIISINNREIEEKVARAAREGSNIPSIILDKMRQDRENAEKNGN